MIYADNAATTKLDPDVYEAMLPFLRNDYANISQPYSFSRSAKKAVKHARESIAEFIGALPDEIYFTSGGTESDNWAIKGFLNSKDKRTVITSQIEHHAILNACSSIEQLNIPVIYLPVDNKGLASPETLKDRITKTTNLVSIMMANNEIGTIQPIQELASITHQNNALFHTDAVQAMGHIPIDVSKLNIDMLSASAHKFNGPKGIGFLYVKKGTPIMPLINGGAQEFGMRAGTENVASIVGMEVALKKNLELMSTTQSHLLELEKLILYGLAEERIDFRRNGAEYRLPGNLSLSFRGCEGEMLLHRLDLMGIMVSTGSACDSQNTQLSHVLKAIGLDPEYALGTIRISLSRDNTSEDAEEIVKALVKILKPKKPSL